MQGDPSDSEPDLLAKDSWAAPLVLMLGLVPPVQEQRQPCYVFVSHPDSHPDHQRLANTRVEAHRGAAAWQFRFRQDVEIALGTGQALPGRPISTKAEWRYALLLRLGRQWEQDDGRRPDLRWVSKADEQLGSIVLDSAEEGRHIVQLFAEQLDFGLVGCSVWPGLQCQKLHSELRYQFEVERRELRSVSLVVEVSLAWLLWSRSRL